jgi:glucose-1-phosphate adenylyltransferase
VSGGCIISGTEIRNSLLFTQVHTNSYASSIGAVVLPYADIGAPRALTKVVIDRGVHIPEGPCRGRGPRGGRASGSAFPRAASR